MKYVVAGLGVCLVGYGVMIIVAEKPLAEPPLSFGDVYTKDEYLYTVMKFDSCYGDKGGGKVVLRCGAARFSFNESEINQLDGVSFRDGLVEQIGTNTHLAHIRIEGYHTNGGEKYIAVRGGE